MEIVIAFNHAQADYTMDLLAAGLRSLCQSVFWFPVKSHLYSSNTFAPEASLWIGEPDCGLQSFARASCNADFSDLLVVQSPPSGDAVDLVERARAHGNCRIVLIDGSDFPDLSMLEALLPEGPWFVREYRKEMDSRARPFPFAFNPRVAPNVMPWSERTVDILWAGKSDYGRRATFLDALETLKGKFEIRCIRDRSLSFDEWNSHLAHSKLCLVLQGMGALTYRHFECAAAGAIPLVQRHQGVIPNDFPDVAAPRFSTPGEMIDTIRNVLTRGDDQLRHMAEEAYTFAWENHTPVHRAAEFLTTVMEPSFRGKKK